MLMLRKGRRRQDFERHHRGLSLGQTPFCSPHISVEPHTAGQSTWLYCLFDLRERNLRLREASCLILSPSE